MTRITAEYLRRVAENRALPLSIRAILTQAAWTLDDLDKDIAVLQNDVDYYAVEQEDQRTA